MKIIIITVILVSFLHSQDMKRIESILDDITELRTKYADCQSTLTDIATLQEQYENKDDVSKLKSKINSLNNALSSRNNIIVENKKILKANEDEISTLKTKINSLNSELSNQGKAIAQNKKVIKQKVDKDENSFPKLILKDKYKNKNSIISFKPSPFRLKAESYIFDAPNGLEIDIWNKHRSFTSGTKTSSWTKITGFFIDKKWQKAKQEMWVESKNTVKR